MYHRNRCTGSKTYSTAKKYLFLVKKNVTLMKIKLKAGKLKNVSPTQDTNLNFNYMYGTTGKVLN